MKVAVIMGSKSDFEIMQDSCKILDDFGIEYICEVVSAHRTPEKMFDFAKNAITNGISVIVAGAGGAAHLPGMVAALTTLPVIGVPIKSKALKGMDSLLSVVQMPAGIPVATVAINGSKNAALIAVSILSLQSDELQSKLQEFRQKQCETVEKDSKIK